MALLGEIIRRFRYRLSRRFDADLDEEMRLHLDLRAAEKQAGGMAADAARAAARRQFGNATRHQERSRGAWGWTRLDTWTQDVRYGLRTLAASPNTVHLKTFHAILFWGPCLQKEVVPCALPPWNQPRL